MRRPVLQLLITVILLGGIAWVVDLDMLVDKLKTIRPVVWLLVSLLLLVQIDVTTRRWACIIRALGNVPPHHRLLKMQYMSLFAQLFMPTSVGGAVVRAWALNKSGIGLANAISSVILDRLFALAGLLLLTAIVVPNLGLSLAEAPTLKQPEYVLAAAAILGVGITVVLWRWPPSFWLAKLQNSFIGSKLRLLTEAARKALKPSLIVRTLAISLAAQFITMLAIFVLAQGSGIAINIVDCLLLLPPVMLIASLPISFGGWGVREGAMIVALGLAGVSQVDALLLSVQFGLLGQLTALIGAYAWFREADSSLLRRESSD